MSSAGDLTSQVHMRISHQIIAVKSESVRCSVVSVFVTPWTVARQAPLSTEFSRQEYWSGLSLSSPRDLPDPGIEPAHTPCTSRIFRLLLDSDRGSLLWDHLRNRVANIFYLD